MKAKRLLALIMMLFMSGPLRSQDVFSPYLVDVDSVKAKSYYEQAFSIANQNDIYIEIDPSQPGFWQFFCDFNQDGFTDLFSVHIMMGMRSFNVFPGISEDSIGMPSYLAGEPTSIKPGTDPTLPEMSVTAYPCCGAITNVYFHYFSFYQDRQWMFSPDTVIEYYDDYSFLLNNQYGLKEITFNEEMSPVWLTLDDSTGLAPEDISYNLVKKGEKILIPAQKKGLIKEGYCPVFVFKTPSAVTMPEGKSQFYVLFGWIEEEYLHE